MSKYINIVIRYQNNVQIFSKTNVLHIVTLWTYTTFEMGLPGLKVKAKVRRRSKTKYFIIAILSYTNTIIMNMN